MGPVCRAGGPGVPGRRTWARVARVARVAAPLASGAMPGRAIQVPPACELTLGAVCVDKSEPGRTVWRMVADERFANPAGIVQGGFVSALADSAMGSAAVTAALAAGRKVVAANAEMKTSFLAAVPVGTVLTATATVVRAGRRVAFVEADVLDASGASVARASSTYLYTDRG